MAANPNWPRWIFASVAFALKQVAHDNNLPVLIEHLDERSDAFMQASDRAEIRITGPFVNEISRGRFRVWVDVNVLLTSRYDGAQKNAYQIHKYAGEFFKVMSQPIPIWNYGNEPGDYVDGDPSSQIFIGCLSPRDGRNDSVRVGHFGQNHQVDKLKQTAVDARYVAYLDT